MHDLLGLFATTEVFVFVFMEVAFNVTGVQRLIMHKPIWYDYLLVICLFGGFSIFGTYTGIPLPGGAISSIRDLGPTVAGLVAGPMAGIGAGLIGGIHRYLQGGFTAVPCSIATVFAGLISGLIYQWRGGKILGIWYSVLLAIGIELFHGAITMLIARPLDDAWEVVKVAIPAMMIANGLGVAIAILAVDRVPQLKKAE
jgi:sigma-B regulation protein RsbU (phosphoserine phosphatase)